MNSTQIAVEIAASPRFKNDKGDYFDEMTAKYGRDIAGIAFIQAALAVDQGAGDMLPADQTPDQKRLASHAALMGITVDELLRRLATWTDEDWAAEDARLS